MNLESVIKLLLELRDIVPEQDPIKVLNESAACLTAYPFLGANNFGLFRASRYSRFSNLGSYISRKTPDFFYDSTEDEQRTRFERTTMSFIGQYLDVYTLKATESLASFLGQKLKKLGLMRLSINTDSADALVININLSSNEYKVRIQSEEISSILEAYENLLQRLGEYIMIDSVKIIKPPRTEQVGYLKTVQVLLNDRTSKRFFDDVVEYLSQKENVQSEIQLLHDLLTVATTKILQEQAYSNNNTDLRRLIDDSFTEGCPVDLFVRLVLNLVVFMNSCSLNQAYYVPSVTSKVDSHTVNYTFLVACLANPLNSTEEDALLLATGFIGSLNALVEQFSLAADAEWKTMFDEIPHTVNNHIFAISLNLDNAKRLIKRGQELDRAEYYINEAMNDMGDWRAANTVLRILARNEEIPEKKLELIRIKNLLQNALKTVGHSLPLLHIDEEKERAFEILLSEEFINSFPNNIEEPSSNELLYRDAALVFFMDLLKNAIRYSDPKVYPVIWVRSEESGGNYILHLYNNLPLGGTTPGLMSKNKEERMAARQEIKNLIEGKIVNEDMLPFSKSGRVGYRICRKICNYLEWNLKVDELSILDDKPTHLSVYIPLRRQNGS